MNGGTVTSGAMLPFARRQATDKRSRGVSRDASTMYTQYCHAHHQA